MTDAEYNSLVVEHFAAPRNVGVLAFAPDVVAGRAGERDQGVEFKLSARIDKGRIVEARFEAYGCPHCVAGGSLLTTLLVGLDLENLQRWSWRDIERRLEAPTAKRGRLLILEDAARAMANDWRRRRL